ncbi:hypothetical protein [Deinococcus depolymerans]|uniref:hypothetical protein n=1 Tax=Deinococcus depolymerans TaxID=392408 RepID=UPI0031D48A35
MPGEHQHPSSSSHHSHNRLRTPLTQIQQHWQRQQAEADHENGIEVRSVSRHASSVTTHSGKPETWNLNKASLHASCTGGVTDLQAFDDAAVHTVTLPYDRHTQQVLTGTHRGRPIWDAIQTEVLILLESFAHVTITHVTVRPWQRGWQRTPAKRLIPTCPLSSPRGGQT